MIFGLRKSLIQPFLDIWAKRGQPTHKISLPISMIIAKIFKACIRNKAYASEDIRGEVQLLIDSMNLKKE